MKPTKRIDLITEAVDRVLDDLEGVVLESDLAFYCCHDLCRIRVNRHQVWCPIHQPH